LRRQHLYPARAYPQLRPRAVPVHTLLDTCHLSSCACTAMPSWHMCTVVQSRQQQIVSVDGRHRQTLLQDCWLIAVRSSCDLQPLYSAVYCTHSPLGCTYCMRAVLLSPGLRGCLSCCLGRFMVARMPRRLPCNKLFHAVQVSTQATVLFRCT
jgi:hypothetical protein